MSQAPDLNVNPESPSASSAGSLSPIGTPPGSPWSWLNQDWIDALQLQGPLPDCADQPLPSVPQPREKTADSAVNGSAGNEDKTAGGASGASVDDENKPIVVQATSVPPAGRVQFAVRATPVTGPSGSKDTTEKDETPEVYDSTKLFTEEAARRRIRLNARASRAKAHKAALSGSKRARITQVAHQLDSGSAAHGTAVAAHLKDDNASPLKKKKSRYTASHLRARRERAKDENANTRQRLCRANKSNAQLRKELTESKAVVTELQKRVAECRLEQRLAKIETDLLEKRLATQRSASDIWLQRVCVLSQRLGIQVSATATPGEAALPHQRQ